ncbi:glutathione ABC transporter permease [Afipia sp. P52-10]|uniref:ABC transporter permease n=1 Tax=Afipia sp. P52-10 TaxID=1429916 RepID=UPI0003DEFCF7|nr:ABC transporter permease [Afipia sp. P52-10]ETR79233.1 glutathione ABC transporter permease [Afipia sp. P52-10]
MAFVLRRVAGAALVIFGTITLVFAILYWLPGDPAVLVAGENATEESIARIRTLLGTERPLWEQYGDYLAGLAQGDLGTSFATQEPVTVRLWAQFPSTLALTLLASTVAIVAGVVAAVSRGRWLDQAIQAVMLFFTSMPSFWLGILLILLFSVTLQWLPAIGSDSFAQLILPVSCLGLVASGRLMRMVRNSVLDVLDEPFVTTLRAKGLVEWQVLFRHVLRNALIPVVTLLGILVGELLSGTVVVETLFARQGIGRLLVDAVGVKDIPVIQGTVLIASISFVLINLLVDLSYSVIDPRVRVDG